jgi:hypothetical protein
MQSHLYFNKIEPRSEAERTSSPPEIAPSSNFRRKDREDSIDHPPMVDQTPFTGKVLCDPIELSPPYGAANRDEEHAQPLHEVRPGLPPVGLLDSTTAYRKEIHSSVNKEELQPSCPPEDLSAPPDCPVDLSSGGLAPPAPGYGGPGKEQAKPDPLVNLWINWRGCMKCDTCRVIVGVSARYNISLENVGGHQ